MNVLICVNVLFSIAKCNAPSSGLDVPQQRQKVQRLPTTKLNNKRNKQKKTIRVSFSPIQSTLLHLQPFTCISATTKKKKCNNKQRKRWRRSSISCCVVGWSHRVNEAQVKLTRAGQTITTGRNRTKAGSGKQANIHEEEVNRCLM